MKILALDLGERRIGIALSDESETIARGLGIIERDGREYEKISGLAREYASGKIVYGVPLRNDGSLSPRGEKMLEIITKLKEMVVAEFIPWDEHMTTKEAETILLMADISRSKRKKIRDKLAAQIILQSYLDSHILKNSPPEETW